MMKILKEKKKLPLFIMMMMMMMRTEEKNMIALIQILPQIHVWNEMDKEIDADL